tara:strand:+ start:746 stop:1282 length:537 start_codon:yes stop_codon:yes gene_type:complete
MSNALSGKGPSAITLPDLSELSGGFASYNDSNTETNKIDIQPGIWTNITCDGLKIGTNIDQLPASVTRLWDVSTNEIKVNELDNSNYIIIRLQFRITPSVNDATVSVRVFWTGLPGFTFQLTRRSGNLNEGAGTEYELSEQIILYIGDDDSRLGAGKIQIKSDSTAEVEIDTVFIGVN